MQRTVFYHGTASPHLQQTGKHIMSDECSTTECCLKIKKAVYLDFVEVEITPAMNQNIFIKNTCLIPDYSLKSVPTNSGQDLVHNFRSVPLNRKNRLYNTQ